MADSYSIIPAQVAVDGTTLQNVNGTLSVKNGGIDVAQLAFTPVKRIATASQPSSTGTFNILTGGNLSITKRYKIVADFQLSGSSGVSLYLNNDTTAANYSNQRNFGTGATLTGSGSGNANFVASNAVNQWIHVEALLSFTSAGLPSILILQSTANTTPNVAFMNVCGLLYVSNVASITQLDFVAASGNVNSGATASIYEWG